MIELVELFDTWRAELDSVLFEHETFWTDRVGDLRTEDTR